MTEAQRKAQQAVQEAMDRRDNGGVTGHADAEVHAAVPPAQAEEGRGRRRESAVAGRLAR